MRKFRLSSQSVLILLALCVAGGMSALDGLFLKPFLARQADQAVARAARDGQEAAALQLQAEETSLRAWCEALAGGQAVASGAGAEPVLKPAGELSHVPADGLWLRRADGRVTQVAWLTGAGASLVSVERAMSETGAPGAGKTGSGFIRVGDDLMLFARHETARAGEGPLGRRWLYAVRKLTSERLNAMGEAASCQLLLVKPAAVPNEAMGNESSRLTYWPAGSGRVAVAWPAKDAAGRLQGCFRAVVDVREIQAAADAVADAAGDILLASFAIIVLVILGTIILLANPISRLLRRVEQIGVDPVSADDLTRSLHAEPLALAKTLRKAFGAVLRLSKTDELTDLANRRHFEQAFQSSFREAQRYRRPLSVIALDIDFFKAVNDSAGHAVGDELIRALGGVIRRSCRTVDLPARQGGDEFVVLMPETAAAGAAVVAERIRAATEQLKVPAREGTVSATVSVGVADMDSGGVESYPDLLALADKALYAAKQGGRNRVVLAHEAEPAEAESFAPEADRAVMLREWIGGIDSQFKALCTRSVQEFVQLAERRDPYMANHARKVSHYAMLIASRMGLGKELTQRVGLAALLHDVGMVALHESVVMSTEALTPEQREALRRHTLIGARILHGASYLESAAPGVKSHHERFDGKGYPDGLTGHHIPLEARIVAVADAFDAMTSPRAFRRPRSVAAALADLHQSSGTQFDPDVVAAFLSEAHRLGEKLKEIPLPKATAEETPALTQPVGAGS